MLQVQPVYADSSVGSASLALSLVSNFTATVLIAWKAWCVDMPFFPAMPLSPTTSISGNIDDLFGVISPLEQNAPEWSACWRY